MVQVLFVRVDILEVIYEDMRPSVGRSVSRCQSGYRVVIYETMIHQCGRSVIQVLVARVDIGLVIYELPHPSVGGQWFMSWLSE